LNPMP
jgi:hypothetical protein